MVGPFRGGRTVSVAGISGQPNVYYFGSVGGGVWKTTNGGVTWNPIFDAEPVASIGAMTIASSDPNIIYVGTGEPDLRSDLSTGNGMYKSTDAGATWQHIGLDDTRQIARIVVNPKDANVIVVAAVGHAYGPNAQRGVFKSTDGGKNWKKVLYKDENSSAIDLAADPDSPRTLYAALWHVQRPPWSQYPPDNGSGAIYRSTDEGETWNPLNATGLPQTDWGRVGIAIARGSGGKRVYALIDTPKDPKQAGLFRSDDGGASWSRIGTDPRILGRLWYFGEVDVDPRNPDVVYLPNVSLYRSENAGKDWQAIKGAPGGDDYHALWIDPKDPNRMIVGSDQGATISVDSGKTWSSWYNQPTAQFYHVITDNEFPYRIYGSQQDSGTVSVASRSDYGSITFRNWYPIGAGESGYIAPDPADANTVYGGDPYGPVLRFDRVTGQTQDVSPSPVQAFGTEMPQRKLRATWTSPIVISPRDSYTLYFGSQFLLRSTDRGMSWQQISPDLTGADPNAAEKNNGSPTLATAKADGYGVIYTVAPSPRDENVIWTGSDTGMIYLTRDAGKSWNNVTPPGLSDWSKISLIDAGHFDPGTAYVTVDRHRLDDMAPYVYRTHDYGKSWTKISDDIAGSAFVRAVREDPVRKGLLFAGTESGVYFSVDDGDHWNPLQLNLPVTPIHDLVVKNNDLVVATHGRSFWVLDDISPLRESTATFADEQAHLFKPANTVRVRRSVNADTPLPPEEPQGQNPPAGAILYYYLHSTASGPLRLEIVDSTGQMVRSCASTDRPEPPRNPPAFPNYWIPQPERLATEAGMHRFVWDLHYAPPTTGGGYSMAVANQKTESLPAGPLVVPGKYTVRLFLGDRQIQSADFEVGPDPRVKTTPQALQQQFDLAKRLYDGLQQASQAMHEIADQRARLKQRPNPDLEPKLTALAGAGRGEEEGGTPPSQPSLRRVSGALSHLLGVVESADDAPTKQASDGAAQVLQQLQALMTQFEQLKSQSK